MFCNLRRHLLFNCMVRGCMEQKAQSKLMKNFLDSYSRSITATSESDAITDLATILEQYFFSNQLCKNALWVQFNSSNHNDSTFIFRWVLICDNSQIRLSRGLITTSKLQRMPIALFIGIVLLYIHLRMSHMYIYLTLHHTRLLTHSTTYAHTFVFPSLQGTLH